MCVCYCAPQLVGASICVCECARWRDLHGNQISTGQAQWAHYPLPTQGLGESITLTHSARGISHKHRTSPPNWLRILLRQWLEISWWLCAHLQTSPAYAASLAVAAAAVVETVVVVAVDLVVVSVVCVFHFFFFQRDLYEWKWQDIRFRIRGFILSFTLLTTPTVMAVYLVATATTAAATFRRTRHVGALR